MNYKAPGKMLLKVVGILLIIFGAISLISGVINMGTVNQMKAGTLDPMVQSIYDSTGITADLLMVSVVTGIISGLINLIAGILGVLFCNKTQKAGICLICGIVMIAYALIIAGYSAVTAGFSAMNVISIIFSLILPLLYFWGALKNRQANMEGQNS